MHEGFLKQSTRLRVDRHVVRHGFNGRVQATSYYLNGYGPVLSGVVAVAQAALLLLCERKEDGLIPILNRFHAYPMEMVSGGFHDSYFHRLRVI